MHWRDMKYTLVEPEVCTAGDLLMTKTVFPLTYWLYNWGIAPLLFLGLCYPCKLQERFKFGNRYKVYLPVLSLDDLYTRDFFKEQLIAQIIKKKDLHTVVCKILWEGFVFFHMDLEVHLAIGVDFVNVKIDVIYINVGAEELVVFAEFLEGTSPRREAQFEAPIIILRSPFQYLGYYKF